MQKEFKSCKIGRTKNKKKGKRKKVSGSGWCNNSSNQRRLSLWTKWKQPSFVRILQPSSSSALHFSPILLHSASLLSSSETIITGLTLHCHSSMPVWVCACVLSVYLCVCLYVVLTCAYGMCTFPRSCSRPLSACTRAQGGPPPIVYTWAKIVALFDNRGIVVVSLH